MDAQIGRILDALEETGQGDNTYIIFTADHGLAVGRHGLMGKQNMYEHSLKAPLVLTGPGIPADRRLDGFVYLQDIAPTTLELAGVELPGQMRYKSLMPLIRGERDTNYDAVYGAYMDKQRMARQGRHKLIYYPNLERYHLFDLETDPNEMDNRIDDPRHAPLVETLKARLRALQEETGDALSL